MTSIECSGPESLVWFRRLTAALSRETVDCFARRMLIDDTGDTFFKQLTAVDQWGACQVFPESPEEFAARWAAMSGPCSGALPAELVQTMQGILQEALGAREFDDQIPLFTYTL